MKQTFVIIFGLLILVGIVTSGFAEVQVHAAASLSDALKEIAAGYEQETGQNIVFNFGASSILARQIQEGAPGDIFFSADEAKMDGLEKKGLLQNETRKTLLSNTLTIVVTNDSTVHLNSAIELMAIKGNIAIAEPQSVPAGIYARQYLKKIGIWEKVIDRLIPTDNVRAALAAVESGNVDAGIVYKTDAEISKKVKIAYEIPREEGPGISYPLAVLKNTRNVAAATRFYNYLLSSRAIDIYLKYGFLLADGINQ